MNTNETLKELRQIAARVIRFTDSATLNPDVTDMAMRLAEDANALAERVQAIDTWLSSGGSLPSEWQNGERRS